MLDIAHCQYGSHFRDLAKNLGHVPLVVRARSAHNRMAERAECSTPKEIAYGPRKLPSPLEAPCDLRISAALDWRGRTERARAAIFNVLALEQVLPDDAEVECLAGVPGDLRIDTSKRGITGIATRAIDEISR